MCAFTKPRTSRPATTRSSVDIATWVVMKTARSFDRLCPAVVAPSFNPGRTSDLADCRAGTSPNTSVVVTAKPIAAATRRQSTLNARSRRHGRGQRRDGCRNWTRGEQRQSGGRCAANKGEQQTLGEQLTYEAAPTRSERQPHADFARAIRGPSQQQVRDVDAGQQQDETYNCQEQTGEDGGGQREFWCQGASRVDGDHWPQAIIWLCRRQLSCERRQIRLGLADRHAGPQASDDLDAARRGAGRSNQRHKEFRNERRHRARELRLSDTDDRLQTTIDDQRLSEHGGASTEAQAPASIAQDHNTGSTRLIVGWR